MLSRVLATAGPHAGDIVSRAARAHDSELADSGSAGRAARAAVAVVALASPMDAMRGMSGQAENYARTGANFPASELRSFANRLTTAVAQSQSSDGPAQTVRKPFAEDPSDVAAALREAGVSPHPSQPQYSGGRAAVSGGQLSQLSPQGLYEGHQLHCASCRSAFTPGCYIHVLCGMLEYGVTLPFEEIPNAPFHDPPRPLLRLDSTDPEEAERARSATATFDQWIGYGALEGPLTVAQTADPSYCFYISNVDMAPRTKPVLRSGLAAAAAARDLPAICRAADMEAALFVENYLSECRAHVQATGRNPDCATLFDTHARVLRKVTKWRPVVWLHRTLNGDLRRTSIEFASAFDLLGALEPGDTVAISDGQSAYNQVPVAEHHRRYLCCRHPVTGSVYRYRTLTMGLGPAVTMFSGIMAEIKKILAAGPAAAQGGLVVSGIIDDVAEGTRPAHRAAQRAFRQGVYELVCYTAQEAKGNDHLDGTTGTYRGLDFDTKTMMVQISHDKLADDVRFACILRRLRDSAFPYVPVRAFESFVGRFGWLAQCNPQLSLHRRGLYRALHLAKNGKHPCVRLGGGESRAPGADDIDWLLARARAGRLSGQRKLLGGAAATVFTTSFATGPVSDDELALRQAAMAHTPAAAAHLSDASVGDDGTRRWASISGGVVHWHEVPAGAPLASAWADEIELEPMAVDFERNGPTYRGKLVVCYSDNIGNVYRANRASAAYGTQALALLDRMYEAAEVYEFDFVVLWVPRSFNQLADLFSKCRTEQEARGWATRHGLRFVCH